MPKTGSQISLINEIEAYIRGAKRYPRVLKEVKGVLHTTAGGAVLKKVNQKQKLAAKHHAAWVKESESVNKLLGDATKKARFSKKLIKLYYKGQSDIVNSFAEPKTRKRVRGKKK